MGESVCTPDSLSFWTGISTISSNVVTTLGIVSIAVFFVSRRHSINEFQFTVMASCVERFQKLFPELLGKRAGKWKIVEYIDLTNEELFYFQRGYIPKEVIVEWLSGILLYLPVYQDGNDRPVNYLIMPFKEIHDDSLLGGYPRLRKALKIPKSMKVEFLDDGRFSAATTKSIIREIAANLQVTLRERHFRNAYFLGS